MNQTNYTKEEKVLSRLTKVETTQGFILDEIKEIKDNHLAGIRKQISRIESSLNARPSWMVSILLTAMSSIIVALVVFVVR